jgi:hypothetical protein
MARPNGLNGAVDLARQFAAASAPQRIGVICQHLTSVGRRCAWYGTTQHVTAMLAASEEEPGATLAETRDPKVRVVMRLTGSPTCVVGTTEPKFRNGIVLRLSPKAAAEVSYNPPSHSLSDLPAPTASGARSSPKKTTVVGFQLGGPGQRFTSATPLGLAQVCKHTPTLTQP